MTSPLLLQMTAPLREDFDIPYHDLGPTDDPPRAALVAGIHGNELNGVFVLSRLASFLADIARGSQPGQRLLKRVVIIPAVNVLGINLRSRVWPFDKTDINRMFPGYDAGETTQRIAWAVLEATRAAYYRIDVHSSNTEFEELPQVRLYEPSEQERENAILFGLPAVIERAMNTVFTSTIGHAWRWNEGENFVIQAGQAGDLQLHHCERLFFSLIAFLQRTGILETTSLSEEEEDCQYFSLNQTFPVISQNAGLFVSRLEVGRWVRSGELIGFLYDAFHGHIRAEIKAPVPGLISGIRRQPLLCEGDLVARIQTRHALEGQVDTSMHSNGQ